MSALSGSLASGAGQVTANLLNPCVPWYHDLGWALATGGVTGGIAGGVGWKVGQWRLAQATRGSAPVAQPLERHHLLPRQFREYFEAAGLNIDAPEFVVELPRDVHRLKPNGLHTGPENWNKLWGDFFIENPNAGREAILAHLDWMMRRFGLR